MGSKPLHKHIYGQYCLYKDFDSLPDIRVFSSLCWKDRTDIAVSSFIGKHHSQEVRSKRYYCQHNEKHRKNYKCLNYSTVNFIRIQCKAILTVSRVKTHAECRSDIDSIYFSFTDKVFSLLMGKITYFSLQWRKLVFISKKRRGSRKRIT